MVKCRNTNETASSCGMSEHYISKWNRRVLIINYTWNSLSMNPSPCITTTFYVIGDQQLITLITIKSNPKVISCKYSLEHMSQYSAYLIMRLSPFSRLLVSQDWFPFFQDSIQSFFQQVCLFGIGALFAIILSAIWTHELHVGNETFNRLVMVVL